MPSFPVIVVRQPQPEDIVDDPVKVAGLGTGFEAIFSARVRDALGADLAEVTITAGGTGIWGNYQVTIPLGSVPETPRGTLEVFGLGGPDGTSEIGLVSVPIIFGRALIDPYVGFAQYTVVAGDTLSAIAQAFYGDAAAYPRIFEANRDLISDPDLIFPGQVLRVPQ